MQEFLAAFKAKNLMHFSKQGNRFDFNLFIVVLLFASYVSGLLGKN